MIKAGVCLCQVGLLAGKPAFGGFAIGDDGGQGLIDLMCDRGCELSEDGYTRRMLKFGRGLLELRCASFRSVSSNAITSARDQGSPSGTSLMRKIASSLRPLSVRKGTSASTRSAPSAMHHYISNRCSIRCRMSKERRRRCGIRGNDQNHHASLAMGVEAIAPLDELIILPKQ